MWIKFMKILEQNILHWVEFGKSEVCFEEICG